MRTSIRQVALHAKVAPITVSRVLGGHDGGVSPATRQKVLDAVAQLDYVPVAPPSSQCKSMDTRIVGVIFENIDYLRSNMGLQIYRGLSDAASKHCYDLLIMLRPKPEWARDREEVQFLDRRTDGFIFVATAGSRRILQALVEHEIPVVACGSADGPAGVGKVMPDNRDAMRQSVVHLHARGHRNIAHVAGPEWHSDELQRAQAFGPEMRAAGLDEFAGQIVGGGSGPQWMHPIESLAAVRALGATAVICCNAQVAMGLHLTARDQGLVLPRDLSLVAINNDHDAHYYGLTAVEVHFDQVAAHAMESWMQLRRGAPAGEVPQITPVELVERSSVADLIS